METGFFGKGGWPCGQLNLRGSDPGTVMAAFRDMEEVSQGLVSLLGANRAEAQQRRLLGRHEQIVERLLETQDGAEQRLRGEDRDHGAEGVSQTGLETPPPWAPPSPALFPHETSGWALPRLNLFPHP